MHIPDGFLNAPISATAYAVSAAACAVALKKANKTLGERQVPLLGITAAFIFAAQMLNFPIAGGTSGHFMGAVLAAILLGPWNALLVMTLVLLIQCLVFADGGLTALGANVFNMGIIGALLSWPIFKAAETLLPKDRNGLLIGAGLAAWISIVLASSACALELALSGTSPLKIALPAMAGIHALIGIGEAIITVTALSVILAVRPDLANLSAKTQEN
jgi:cobalt/nickel transport system permease protein